MGLIKRWLIGTCPHCGDIWPNAADNQTYTCAYCECQGKPVMVRCVAETKLQGAVDAAVARVLADDDALRRARRAVLMAPPHGITHDDAARLEHMRAGIRAAFGVAEVGHA